MIGDPKALIIHTSVPRPEKDVVAAFTGVQTSFITDAQQGFGCLSHHVKPLRETYRFAGTAVTANGGPRDNLAAMAMLDYAEPGDVLVIATGEDQSGAVIGDNWASIARQKGVVAVVTDGLVRDADGIEKRGPPTFARGLSPNAGYPNGPGEINGIISIAGITVRPGDIVCGDRDGVVVVPAHAATAIAESLARVQEIEAKTEVVIDAGEKMQLWDPNKYAARGVEIVD